MNFCQQCSGLIPEPNSVYGYAGKICDCKWFVPAGAPIGIPYTNSYQDDRLVRIEKQIDHLTKMVAELLKKDRVSK